MKVSDIEAAWNRSADKYNQWKDLGADEMVEFTLQYIGESTELALEELYTAIYFPDRSGISVKCAIDNVNQIFSA